MNTPAGQPSTSQALARRRANRRGIALMCTAMSCFIINDALVKWVSESLAPGQLIFIRGLMACALVWLAASAMGQAVEATALCSKPVLLRSGVEACGSLIYLLSLFNLPLANATAINMAAPLVLTVLAVLVLGERVGAARWVAVGIGFAGVLFIVQPRTDGFNAYAWLCLVGTLFHASRDLITRRIPASVSSIVVTLGSAVAVTVAAGLWSAVQGWRPVQLQHLGVLGLAAVFLAVGYFCIVKSMRGTDVTVVSPFRYVGLLFALVLGYAVWGHVPDAQAWAGIALLVGSGLYLLHGQREASA